MECRIDCCVFGLKCSADDDDSSEKNDDELDIENQNQNLAEDRADDEDDESDDNEDEGNTTNKKHCGSILIQFPNFLDDEEDEDDVIQMPLRSYVESNEEMTESDCNVHEDDERTGKHTFSSSHQRDNLEIFIICL